MPIHVDCPTCGQCLTVPSAAAGRSRKCAACGHVVRVPVPRELLAAATVKQESPPLTLAAVLSRVQDGLSAGIEWIAGRPARLAVLALVLVAGCLGVSAAKWALGGRDPVEPAAAKPKPVEPDPWDAIGLSAANDRVRVTAESATTEVITVRRPESTRSQKSAKAFLKIALTIDNLSPSEVLHYSGWGARWAAIGQAATLQDNEGVVHKQFDGRELIEGQIPSAAIRPSGSIQEILVFQTPGTYAKYLRLVLPAGACGGIGELRIKIPRNRFLD